MTSPGTDDFFTNTTYYYYYYNSTGLNDTLADPYGAPEEVSRGKFWSLVVLMPLVMLLILIGNTLVAIAVLKVRVLQTIQNFYLVSLAASDLMVGGLIMPLSLVDELMGYWSMGRTMCDIYVTLDIFACTASILNLCAIGLDRHYAITQAVKYTASKTTKHAVGGIIMVWMASAIICLPPPLLGWGTDSFHSGLYPRCDYTDRFSYVLYSTVGSFFGPLPIMLVVYTRIFIAARSRIRNLQKRSSNYRRPATTGGTPTNIYHVSEGPPIAATRVEVEGKERVSTLVTAGSSSSGSTNPETPSPTPAVLLRPDTLTASYSKHGGKQQEDKNGSATHHPPERIRESSTPTNPRRAVSLEDMDTTKSSSTPNLKDQLVLENAMERRWKIMQAKERRLTIVICIVTGAFVVCWSPFFVTYVLRTVHESWVSTALFRGFVWLGYCNSALNPIIYTLLNTDFRQAFKQVLVRKFNTKFGVNRV